MITSIMHFEPKNDNIVSSIDLKRMYWTSPNFFFSYSLGTIPSSTQLPRYMSARNDIRFILIDMRYFYFFVLYLPTYLTLYNVIRTIHLCFYIHKTLFHILFYFIILLIIIPSYCYLRRHVAVYTKYHYIQSIFSVDNFFVSNSTPRWKQIGAYPISYISYYYTHIHACNIKQCFGWAHSRNLGRRFIINSKS